MYNSRFEEMPAHVLQNEMILASAGAGKTYQLTDRYVALMARGVEPERIIALTFTRKAAGEFFDSILVKLARAAASAEGARSLAASLEIEELTQADFQKMLRKLTTRMHVLSLGTLDGFFVSLIRNFPFEFGLGGGFEILDDHMIALEKSRVYRQVFQRARTRQRQQRDFLEAFKLATFGSEQSTLLRDLNSFIDNHHEVYLGAPRVTQWGNPPTIWPDGCPWLENGSAQVCDLVGEAARLIEALDFERLNQRQQTKWEEFANEITLHSSGTPLPEAMTYFLPKLLEVYPAMLNGEAILTVYKKQSLGAEACAILSRIVKTVVGREVENKLRQTRGIWMVLNQYEQAYSKLVRRRGKLTFYDLQLILGGGENLEQVRPLLTQRPGTQARLRIDYRLDTRYDHWLLDEFQDTSHLQWSVIENLIDEAVQDTSGQRSLFQVGDLKQAIYAWRGGDVTLFDDIRNRYNQTGETERIVERPLNDSWRSGPAVIEMVNSVFGNEEMLRYLFPSKTVDRWRWGEHVSRHPELNGFACCLQPTGSDYGFSPDEQLARRLDLMLDILREVDPARRGLSCAVLVQTNKVGQQVVDWIRANSDLRVVSESLVHVAEDNPATSALLDVLQFAAHPGDMFAWQHLMMTPMAELLERSTAEKLVFEVLDQSHREGFEQVVLTWGQRLDEAVPDLDDFSRHRLDELASAAREFDASGNRSIAEFIQFARNYAIREPAAGGVVQVMTIHKSKGLGFDVVMLPDLGGQALTVIRRGLAVHRHPDRSVAWVMSLPQKGIARADPQLNHYHEEKEAESAYEGLCTLYVAMTRAKRAMYVIADKVPKRSAPSANYPRLLEKTLGRDGEEVRFGNSEALALFQSGDRNWVNRVADHAPPAHSEEKGKTVERDRQADRPARRQRFRRRTPSGAESHRLTGAQLFSRKGSDARGFGIQVHELFEQIEWLSPDTSEQLKMYASARDIGDRVLDEVLFTLDAPDVRAALESPAPDAILWREKRFEIVLDGEWITGTFDRVVLVPGKRARILDYKTDTFDGNPDDAALASKAAAYVPQLAIYRDVLARVSGLRRTDITCALVFTRARRVWQVEV